MRITATIAAGIGLGGGVVVTRDAHRRPRSPWWAERVGTTRLRRADMPLGGTLFALLAMALRGRRVAGTLAGLAVGAAAGAIGTGMLDPLPAN